MSGHAKNETHARLASSGEWAERGSITEHLRYVQLMSSRFRNRRRCSCGCGGKESHVGMCNGLAMMGGCEWSVRLWTRDPDAGTRAWLGRYWEERMAQPNAAIRCSADDCSALVIREVGENLRTTRAHARAAGWRYLAGPAETPKQGRDFCPKHPGGTS